MLSEYFSSNLLILFESGETKKVKRFYYNLKNNLVCFKFNLVCFHSEPHFFYLYSIK